MPAEDNRTFVRNLEDNLLVALLTPLGDPNDSTCQKGANVLYWGPPGIGKSAIIRSAARKCMLHLEVLYAGTKQPEDFSGVLVPDGKGGATSVCALAPIRRLMGMKDGILFLDEVSCAPPAVQGALLSLELERNVGDSQLPPGVRILAAANPADQAAGGFELEPPQANRFFHFHVAPPKVDDWLRWYAQEGDSSVLDTEDLWAKLCKAWPVSYSRVKSQISGFIKKTGDGSLHNIPEEGHPDRYRAWPSPRTWWMAGRAAATAHAIGKAELSMDFVEAAVGKPVAESFSEWVRNSNLPDPQDMLKNGWSPNRQRADIAVAAYTGMTSYITELPSMEEKLAVAVMAWKNLEAACNAGLKDLAMVSSEKLVQQGLCEADVPPEVMAAAKPVISQMARSAMMRFHALP